MFNNFKDLVYRCRSIRRFDQSYSLSAELLIQLVDLARLSPSGMNMQWLRYKVVTDQTICSQVFKCLTWASYLSDWSGPVEGERPTGYIIVLEDETFGKGLSIDAGFAAQNILLGAVSCGLGGCVIAGIDRKSLCTILGLSSMRISLVLALGKPIETVQIVDMPLSNDVRYWRSNHIHYVPKRRLLDIIV